jgi:ABC-type lipoprotein export system ATPase subunit
MKTIAHDTIFTNVAMTKDGDVWWEGKDGDPPTELTDWQGKPVEEGLDREGRAPELALHGAGDEQPGLSQVRDDPEGVPISAIIFGGRRATTIPLVMQAFNWMNGVFLGATLGSRPRRRPPARSASCGATRWRCSPSAATTWASTSQHWLDMQARSPTRRRSSGELVPEEDKDGKFLWPGFGENMRVLKWIVDRARLRVGGQETLFGWVPKAGDLDLSGLDIPHEQVDEATHIDLDEWKTSSSRSASSSFVFQFHHLLPEFNALENVMMPGLIQGRTKKELAIRASALLEEVGLKDRAPHRPGELSGGEQQRVALARALILDPKLILADEPTGNLDSATSSQIHELFFTINKQRGTTIVVVTHNTALAASMPRVVTLKDGRVEKDDWRDPGGREVAQAEALPS